MYINLFERLRDKKIRERERMRERQNERERENERGKVTEANVPSSSSFPRCLPQLGLGHAKDRKLSKFLLYPDLPQP